MSRQTANGRGGCNVLETDRQRVNVIFLVHGHRGPCTGTGGGTEVSPSGAAMTENTMNPINEEHSRIANHECGAQLDGDSGALFGAVGAHLAHQHREPLGAIGLDMGHTDGRGTSGAINA
jgi:hypothetical protein